MKPPGQANFRQRIRSILEGIVAPTKESPRELQERHDLYKSIIASTYRDSRSQCLPTLTRCDDQDSFSWKKRRHPSKFLSRGTKLELEKLTTEAIEKLDGQMEIYKMSNRGLRYELQNLLIPQLLAIFECFQSVDKRFQDGQDNVQKLCEHVLRKEYENLAEILAESRIENYLNTLGSLHYENVRMCTRLSFLRKKYEAISIVAQNRWCWDSTVNRAPRKEEFDSIDPFGYSRCNDNQDVTATRYHQMINLSKATILRDETELGYSVLALQSTIPNAGRGIYVDGFAPAGSILAFFPGQIWPKESLLNMNTNMSQFKDDPNYLLSLRYDDVLIDSRKSPYTVLDHDRSNRFSIAHIANHCPLYNDIVMNDEGNHPSKEIIPANCHTVMINFTDQMNLKQKGLEKYLPNTYARPNPILGQSAFDRDAISVHGLGLMASRDVYDEELFYDYRLSPGQDGYPEWYSIVDEECLQNRWYQKN